MNMISMGEISTGEENFAAPPARAVLTPRPPDADFLPPAVIPEKPVLSPERPDNSQLTAPEMTAGQKFEAMRKTRNERAKARGHETRQHLADTMGRVSDKLFGGVKRFWKETKTRAGNAADYALGIPGATLETGKAGLEATAEWVDLKIEQVTDAKTRFIDRVNDGKNRLVQRAKNVKDRTTAKVNELTKKGAIMGLKPFVPAQDAMMGIMQIPDSIREWRAARFEMKAMKNFHKREVLATSLSKLKEKGDSMSVDDFDKERTKFSIIDQMIQNRLERNMKKNEQTYAYYRWDINSNAHFNNPS